MTRLHCWLFGHTDLFQMTASRLWLSCATCGRQTDEVC